MHMCVYVCVLCVCVCVCVHVCAVCVRCVYTYEDVRMHILKTFTQTHTKYTQHTCIPSMYVYPWHAEWFILRIRLRLFWFSKNQLWLV